MSRSYWLDLFTWETWQGFLASDRTVSGFREGRRGYVAKMKVGDYLLCYLTGVSRFVGILEVVSEHYHDESLVWQNEAFPERVKVNALVILSAETGVPAQDLVHQFSWSPSLKRPNDWGVYFQGSPVKLADSDGEVIMYAVLAAEESPVEHAVDPKKLNRKARVSTKAPPTPPEPVFAPTPFPTPTTSTPPAPEDEAQSEPLQLDEGLALPAELRSHTEMEGLLLTIGSELGLELWVDPSDRGQLYDGRKLGDIPGVLLELPHLGFAPEMMNRVERIDVLWLNDSSVVAAFEVESTTAVYSGLLRMADLIALVPNNDIPLFIVAPAIRRGKVRDEVWRPTFAKALSRPLATRCRLITFEALREKAPLAKELREALRPGPFLKTISESLEERKRPGD